MKNNSSFTIKKKVICFQVPALGHIPQICQVMASSNTAVPKSALQVIHVLASNEVNIIFASLIFLSHLVILNLFILTLIFPYVIKTN